MGRMKFGNTSRYVQRSIDIEANHKFEIQTTTHEMIDAALIAYFEANPVEVKEVPLTTMAPSCACACSSEPKVIERTEVIIKEISTKDQRARNHSVATRNELHAMVNRKHDLLNRAISIQSKKAEEQHARLHALEQRKPEEKQVVIEKTEVQTKSHPLVIGGLVVSLLLNVLILIVK